MSSKKLTMFPFIVENMKQQSITNGVSHQTNIYVCIIYTYDVLQCYQRVLMISTQNKILLKLHFSSFFFPLADNICNIWNLYMGVFDTQRAQIKTILPLNTKTKRRRRRKWKIKPSSKRAWWKSSKSIKWYTKRFPKNLCNSI